MPLGGQFTCEGGIGIVPQSFRPAFSWQVRDVVLMGRARHVNLFAQPSAEDERRGAGGADTTRHRVAGR